MTVMELTGYELALVVGGVGIAGTLIGVLSTYRLSIQVADRQFQYLRQISKLDAWHAAAYEFTAAFTSYLAVLESDPDLRIDVSDFFRSEYIHQSQAIATFEPFVPEERRGAYKNEWLQHCYGADSRGQPLTPYDEELAMDHDTLLFLHYSREAHRSHPELPRRLGIKAIRGLLSYAAAT